MPNPSFNEMPRGIEVDDTELKTSSGDVASLEKYKENVAETRGRISNTVAESAAQSADRLRADRQAADFLRKAIENSDPKADYKKPGDYFPEGFKVKPEISNQENVSSIANNEKEKRKQSRIKVLKQQIAIGLASIMAIAGISRVVNADKPTFPESVPTNEKVVKGLNGDQSGTNENVRDNLEKDNNFEGHNNVTIDGQEANENARENMKSNNTDGANFIGE